MKSIAVVQIKQSVLDPDTNAWKNIIRYRVVRVTNSIAPSISDYIEQDEVNTYCIDSEWNVTIK